MSARLSAKPEIEDDKISLLGAAHDAQVPDGSEVIGADAADKDSFLNTQDHLDISRNGPVRAPSSESLSNFSVDDPDQARQGRRALPLVAGGGRRHNVSRSPAPPKTWRGKWCAFWARNKGLVLMLLAQIFAVLMNATTRLLEIEGNEGKGLHPLQVLFARMFITLVLSSAYMWFMKTPYFPLGMKEVRWLLVARGIGGFFGVFGMYYSLLYLPLADATVITFLTPGLACWACSILIKEPYTRVEQIGGLVSLVGVVLIARPSSLFSLNTSNPRPSAIGTLDGSATINGTKIAPLPHSPDASSYDDVTPAQRLTAVGVALVGVIGGATAYTTIRWIGKRAHPLISVNYFAAWCTIVSIVLMLALPSVGFLIPSGLKDWAYLVFLGTCGFIMQFLLAAGLSHERSSRATNMTYTSMLFALAFDKLFFGTTPGITSIIGSSLILGSAIYVAMQKSARREEEDRVIGRRQNGDEEEAMPLVDENPEVDGGGNENRDVEEVQMRTLR
ncbi:MAG: hypothetical protein M1822_001437 [Bathelium mastoideum]|nr:MAG: hypothetical protein M1822_001437 [Bathelium mastoideum]